MLIDPDKIITETQEAFSSVQKKFQDVALVDEETYNKLHTAPLVPLDMKIDVKAFVNDIHRWDKYFEQWGNKHTELARFGLAVVNEDGILKTNDPVNGSLMAWNQDHPGTPYIELDFKEPTAIITMGTLAPIDPLKPYMCRSNIFKWGKGAKFMPHVDNFTPSPWLRLWGTTSKDVKVRFAEGNEMKETTINIEPGRIYLIDTTLIHDAYYEGEEWAYQFFLSVTPEAVPVIEQHIANEGT